MLQRARQLSSFNFIKVTSANSVITLGKTLLVVISNKVVATIIGTTGIAMLGQLQNFISIITLIANGGFNQGLTKYIAENKNEEKNVVEFIGTAFITSFILSSIVGIILLIFSKPISYFIFSSTSYFIIIVVFAFTLLFFSLNSIILTIVNGFQLYKQYFKINITITVIGFIFTIILVYFFEVFGALLAIVLSQSVVSLFAFLYIKNSYWIKAFSFNYFNTEKLRELLKYTSITFLAAIFWPVIDLFTRTYVIKNISPQEAGLWQATQVINMYIVGLTVGSFSVYLLPKLSSIKDNLLIKKELIGIYKIIIPASLIGFLIIYFLRDFVVLFLYTKEFLKVGEYIPLQMVGTFFWMLKSPIMYFMLAKKHLKVYIINELVFAFMYAILVFILIPKYQVQGIQLAFAINNFFYFAVNLFLIRKFLK